MEMSGERRIPAPRQKVWEALNDPEVLRVAIPGCESVERQGDDAFTAKVGVKLGPMSAKFSGKVKLENLNPPAGYTISGEGSGGAMGFAKGGADVALAETSATETLLTYNVKAQVGGKIAQLGARLIDSTAKQMADQFFDRFAAQLTPDVAAAGAPATEAVPAAEQAAAAAADPARVIPPDATPGYVAPATNGSAPAATGAAPAGVSGKEGVFGGPPPAATPDPLEPAMRAGTMRPASPLPPAPSLARPLPESKPISLISIALAMEPFGLPLVFWGGSAVFLVVLALLFL